MRDRESARARQSERERGGGREREGRESARARERERARERARESEKEKSYSRRYLKPPSAHKNIHTLELLDMERGDDVQEAFLGIDRPATNSQKSVPYCIYCIKVNTEYF